MIDAINRNRGILKLDFCFVLLGVVSLIALIDDSLDATMVATARPDSPLLAAGGAIALTVILALVVSKLANLDRRCSEEYGFQVLANGAVVGVMTALIGNLLWTFDFLLGHWMGEPTADQIVAMLMGGWAMGYFIYRIRGVAA